MAGGFVCFSVTEHKAAMGNAAVIFREFLFRNEVYGGLITDKIVGHGFDSRFNGVQVGAFFRYDEAFPQVHFIAGGVRSFSAADCVQVFLFGDGVLLAVLNAGDAADGIGMALAYAFAPESVALAFRQYAVS